VLERLQEKLSKKGKISKSEHYFSKSDGFHFINSEPTSQMALK
jgi:hypothetical protein